MAVYPGFGNHGADWMDKMSNDELLQPFYDYLKNRRQALLTELDNIERTLGTSPRTAEIRRLHNGKKLVEPCETATIAGITERI
jgi:hypothetical protein